MAVKGKVWKLGSLKTAIKEPLITCDVEISHVSSSESLQRVESFHLLGVWGAWKR